MKTTRISFTNESILAYQAGRKTMTRRVIKLKTLTHRISVPVHWEDNVWMWPRLDNEHPMHLFKCPYGQPGDRLAFKERYQIAGAIKPSTLVYGHYLADGAEFNTVLKPPEFAKWKARKFPFRATPGRFMYNSLIRYKPQVLSVKVERVQEISEEDAKAEGLKFYSGGWGTGDMPYTHPADAFAALWDSIHGSGAWERNEWCWCVEFEKVNNAK